MARLFTLLLLMNLVDTYVCQVLIINEVSQGVSGNKEYVEFLVADTAAFYDCGLTSPPCVDIRGWIFDDNSGYHGSGGVAPGAIRFSNDPLWSCMELGTIIVIYNDADPNPMMPPDDLTNSDGNCAIVAPVSNTSLFESNPTTPGAVACSYPSTGWIPGGNWSSTVLANSGDCARIVDLAGCEVFSVCWASNNMNTQIYFSGGSTSGSSATNTVYFFNGSDPTVQSNWTIGCADVAACGVEEQTPGAPNNPANAAYIAQFNNGCTALTPISANAAAFDACGCNGLAVATGSGSIPGYTYEWTDSLFVPIGQNTDTASGLCSGDYYVIVTSSIGCADTVMTTISNIPAPNAGSGNSLLVCDTDTSFNLQDSLIGPYDLDGVWVGTSTLSGDSLGTFDPRLNSTGTYLYIVGSGGICPDTALVSVDIATPPLFFTLTDSVCIGENASFSIEGTSSILWWNGATSDTLFVPVFSDTIVSASALVPGCGEFLFTDTAFAYQVDPVSLTISPAGELNICDGDSIAIVGNSNFPGTYPYSWNTGDTNDTITVSLVGEYYLIGDGLCFTTVYSDTLFLVTDPCIVEPTEIVIPNVFTPNQDGLNDSFRFTEYMNIISAKGTIWNRWGQLLYNWDGLDDSWNGRTSTGEMVKDGVYYYVFEFVDVHGEQIRRTGHITLSRLP
ncbi:MAG: hypothetical protein CL833_05490 [Crocinitomicaceae bacterium]|nr:hypothetical protein [Crocinitomicaceae bacterium]